MDFPRSLLASWLARYLTNTMDLTCIHVNGDMHDVVNFKTGLGLPAIFK